jgi:co-chaperonin GroES (HSP10)
MTTVKFKAELKSQYLDRFRALESLKEKVYLTGDKIMIEQIKMDELKTESGLIIPTRSEGYARSTTTQGMLHIGLVILTGEINTLPSGKVIKPGAVVWVGEFGVRPCTTFPGLLEKTDEVLQETHLGNIQMVFENLEAYQEAVEVLNGAGK